MWWPSFVAVLHDLWLFVCGRTPAVDEPVRQLVQQPVSVPQTTTPTPVRQQFQILSDGVVYEDVHPSTVIIRNYLHSYDPHLVRTGVLTTAEWLAYTLLYSRDTVPVLALFMTPPGKWHVTLRGLPGVVSGIAPRTNALMEWVQTATDSTLAFVLAVTPDETIKVGLLGGERPGLYTVATYTRAQWLELRPVFTTV